MNGSETRSGGVARQDLVRTDRPVRESDQADTVMRTCPNCGAELTERKCKLICPDPRCGYFLSCSDYY